MRKAVRRAFPLKAMFELTYRCNLKCRYCYVKPPVNGQQKSRIAQRNELNAKEVFHILDQLAEAGCLNIGFTGGEPFLRKDVFDILEYAKKKGFNVIILTNGTLITPEKADSLKRLGLNKIDISFHTADEDTFDWFTKTAGTYKKVLRSIELLRERGIEVYLKTTAMTINKDNLINIRHLAVERFGAHFRWGPEVTRAWDGGKENLKFRLMSQELLEIEKALQKDAEIEFEKLDSIEKKGRMPERRKGRHYKIDHSRLFRCGAGRTEVVISPFGKMRLCPDIMFPDYPISKGNFSEGWRTLSDYVKSTPPGHSYRCDKCKFVQYCDVCPARGLLECGDMSACPPYLKKMAKLVKREAEKDE